MARDKVEILLVEDDPGDADLTREALEEGKIDVGLRVVQDGVEAMRYLRREGQYAQATRPDFILLDLNLPKKDGREVLEELKADPELKTIPVVIMSTSDAETDILRSYDLGAACYVNKPVGLDEFTKIVHAIEDFWLTVVRLPGRRSREL